MVLVRAVIGVKCAPETAPSGEVTLFSQQTRPVTSGCLSSPAHADPLCDAIEKQRQPSLERAVWVSGFAGGITEGACHA